MKVLGGLKKGSCVNKNGSSTFRLGSCDGATEWVRNGDSLELKSGGYMVTLDGTTLVSGAGPDAASFDAYVSSACAH